MVEFPFDIVAFDLDGTLLESHRDLGTAVNHALALGGFAKVPIESASSLIGGGAKAMLKQAITAQGGLEEDAFHHLYKEMLAYYSAHYAVHSRLYPGATDVLHALRDMGVRTAIVTNKFEEFARGILSELRIDKLFDCVIGGDTLGKGKAKPAPDPLFEARRRCGGGSLLFVGDSSYDMRAARAGGFAFVVACYGYCDLAQDKFDADGFIDSLDALVPVASTL